MTLMSFFLDFFVLILEEGISLMLSRISMKNSHAESPVGGALFSQVFLQS